MPQNNTDTMILGLSCFYHDSAACLMRNGIIIAAAQEERFSRVKHDPRFPTRAIDYCLTHAGIGADALDMVIFYDKPIQTFERILMSHFAVAPRSLRAWLAAVPVWLRRNLHVPRWVQDRLHYSGDVLFTEHHEAHAASAFYPSPFDRAAVMTIDGVGEWATATCGVGKGNRIQLIKELHFPDSLGLLYSAFTYFTGFRVNSGEYKLMGLAPYGTPRYADRIFESLVDVKADGSLRLNQDYFNYIGGLVMTNRRFSRLFDGPPRTPESPITQREMDLAASVQQVTEEVVLRMARHLHAITGESNLCMAGGVALNCVANGRLLREGPFEHIWIQPAAGDAGGAVGAAYCGWHRVLGRRRSRGDGRTDAMAGAYLGPSFSPDDVRRRLSAMNASFRRLAPGERADMIAGYLDRGMIVGHFSGRMEFGPRALGARSILGDPRRPDTQRVMNLKIKHRESFRPFAPSVLTEKTSDYFELTGPSPYMLLAARVRNGRCVPQPPTEATDLMGRLHFSRSDIPAVTHVDYSARIQTVARDTHPDYFDVIAAFERRTGCAVVVNTSFNVRGEPIVCTPEEAYRCFMRTQMDVLVIEDSLLLKAEQPPWHEGDQWRGTFSLD